jgi:hypothetical protein
MHQRERISSGFVLLLLLFDMPRERRRGGGTAWMLRASGRRHLTRTGRDYLPNRLHNTFVSSAALATTRQRATASTP